MTNIALNNNMRETSRKLTLIHKLSNYEFNIFALGGSQNEQNDKYLMIKTDRRQNQTLIKGSLNELINILYKKYGIKSNSSNYKPFKHP